MRQKFDVYPSYQQYVVDVTPSFGDAYYEDLLATLVRVKQTRKLQEYVDAFELALTQVSLIPEHSLSIFLAGLEHNTQMHVRMFNPTSIAHVANLKKLHYSSQTLTKTPTRFTSWKPSTSGIKPTTPTQTANLTSYSIPTQKPLFNRTTRTLTNAEIADRRGKGVCWFCDEPFSPGNHLKHRKNHLMILESWDGWWRTLGTCIHWK